MSSFHVRYNAQSSSPNPEEKIRVKKEENFRGKKTNFSRGGWRRAGRLTIGDRKPRLAVGQPLFFLKVAGAAVHVSCIYLYIFFFFFLPYIFIFFLAFLSLRESSTCGRNSSRTKKKKRCSSIS